MITDREKEVLYMLIEECSEVQHIVSKILRHGWTSSHPDYNNIPNEQLLKKEIADLRAILWLLEDYKPSTYTENIASVVKKKLQYTHHIKDDYEGFM